MKKRGGETDECGKNKSRKTNESFFMFACLLEQKLRSTEAVLSITTNKIVNLSGILILILVKWSRLMHMVTPRG